MWGFRSPTPRGRTESGTLRILTDALTGAHEKHCMWRFTTQMPFPTAVGWLIHAGRGSALLLTLWHSCGISHPIRRAAGCAVTLHFSPPPPREHQKRIRRMRSVQDSVLPEGRGGRSQPPHSNNPLIHSEPCERIDAPEHEGLGNPQGRQARNPQMRSIVIHRAKPVIHSTVRCVIHSGVAA